ncbi:tRNA methyltransferase roswell [Calliopsis andreniformis]|uniref:tRNA methyltransferase roswell n=1 Tax=Calliopsis andreniformis TaxID=337506 RepID=UPI003FCE68F2
MFSNSLRSCATVAKQFYFNGLVYSARYKYIKSKFLFSTREHCVMNYALANRCYCKINRSVQVTTEYHRKYEEKLKELLKDPQYQQLYDKLQLEVEYVRHSTHRIPTTFRAYDWLMLFSLKTRSQRRGFLNYLWICEQKTVNKIQKKELRQVEKQAESEIKKSEDISGALKYGLHFNTFLLRIYETTMYQFYNSRLMNAMMYEPTVVFDLGYDSYMTSYEAQNCVKQLVLSFSINRIHADPFNLYFCNANKDSFVMQKLHQSIPTIYDLDFPLNITSKSYLDIFDKKQLIYLSPHAQEVVNKYDPNMVYIIGAMVDKVSPQPLSVAKAKQEGIKTAKLPLSNYLHWGSGSGKNLPLNQVLSILLDARLTNDWLTAFQHIPSRKLQKYRDTKRDQYMSDRSQMIEKLMQQK